MTLCLLLPANLFPVDIAGATGKFSTQPSHHNGSKWRVGYYEGGPYVNYPANLKAIVEGLAIMGWMDKPDYAESSDATDSKRVWVELTKATSEHLNFDPQNYYSSDWNEDLRTRNKKEIIEKLQRKDIDLIIAMGTWAGQDLANNLHSVPVMVVSSSDPVKAGIVKSASYSGFDHVHAKCAPNRYRRQISLFHGIIGFKRLGIVFENTKVGRTYAAIEDIQIAATRHGFQVVTCEAPNTGGSLKVRTQGVLECHEKLAPKIDALYLTVHTGVDPSRMEEILSPLLAHKVPTWSQRGPQEVKDGVLMSISRGGFGPVGMFHAVTIAKILNGARPGELDQIFEDPKTIAINLDTAKAIGFKPSKGLIKVADEIYRK